MALRRSPGLVDKLNGIRTNSLTNGGFAYDASSWTAGISTPSVTAAGARAGSGNCLQLLNSTAAAGSLYQEFTTRPGRIHRVSWAQANGTTTAGGQVVVAVSGGGANIATSAVSASAAWVENQLVFIATSATTRITLQNVATTLNATCLYDDIVVEEVLEGFREIMRLGFLSVYTGAQPATADLPATGNLLYTLTNNGDGTTGLTWGDSSGGVIAKESSEQWRGSAVAAGTAGWFRFYEAGDTPTTASTKAARFDGLIATSGGEMNMTNTAIELGAVQTCTTASYTAPM